MKKMGGRNYQLWDEKEGFFHDVLRYPNGEFHKFRLRSLVGLIPLYAIEVLESEELAAHPGFLRDVEWFIQNRPDLVGDACYTVGDGKKRYVLSIADPNQFRSAFLGRIFGIPPSFFLLTVFAACRSTTSSIPFQFKGRSMGYEPGEPASS
jgi:hypothetical protein